MCAVVRPTKTGFFRCMVSTALTSLTLCPDTRAQTGTPHMQTGTLITAPAATGVHAAQSLQQLVANANFWTEQGRPDLARQAWRKVLRIAPNHAKARMAMGLPPAMPATAPAAQKSRPRAGRPSQISQPSQMPQPSQISPPAATQPALHKDPWALFALAKQELNAEQPVVAQALIDEGVLAAPDDPDMRYAAALFARLTDRSDDGLAHLAAIDETKHSPSMRALRQGLNEDMVKRAEEQQKRQAQQQLDKHLQQLEALLDQGQADVALAQALQLQTQYPAHPQFAWQVAKAAQAAQQWPLARRALATAQELSRQGPDSSRWIEALAMRQLDNIETRRQPYVEIANYRVRKPGDAAVSQLNLDNTSLRVVWPQSDTGHWLLKFDRLQLDAGNAALPTLLANDWGTTPLGTSGFPASVDAQTSTSILAAVFDSAHWRVDLGTTPSALSRTRWTGGGLYRVETASTRWRLSLARRPVLSSLLSYVGQRDPGTGLVWGGVDRTALRVQASTAWGERVSTSVSAGAARYTGEHVLSNAERFASASWDYALVRRADMFFEISPSVRWQSFANNQNHYSFGYGGYYSPQQLQSRSLSLTYAQRTPSTSWLLRGNWSQANSRTQDGLLFPNDPVLQARANSNNLAGYLGSSSAGTGASWQGGFEHRLHPHWVVGAYLSHEKSTDYQQKTLLLYLRWYKKNQLEAPSLWPTRNFLGVEP